MLLLLKMHQQPCELQAAVLWMQTHQPPPPPLLLLLLSCQDG
jgi:hypothetical protein